MFSSGLAVTMPPAPQPTDLPKAALRRQLIRQRQQLSSQVWRQNSDRICAHLLNWDYFHHCRVILSYTSFRQEPDLSPLAHHHGDWGLPRCVDRTLHWHAWSVKSPWPLNQGAYGILEPHPQSPRVDPSLVDLILVPAVACDRRGYRLGYGAGYYDRLLSQSPWNTIPTLGIVFDYARLETVPQDSWDQPLQGVCSETGLFFS